METFMAATPLIDDEAFVTAVNNCQLLPSEFGHLQHLRLGWLQLRSAPLEMAIEETCTALARFATHYGAENKFHRTITEVLLRLMAQGGAMEPEKDWPCFLHCNQALVNDARSVLARHYSPTLLASDEARRHFLPPDRLPFNA
jgi:hypothetical protein